MRTGNHGIEVRAGDSQSPATPEALTRDRDVRLSPDPSGEPASRARWWVPAVAAAVVVVLVAVVVSVVALTRGTDEDLVRGTAPAAVQPPAPAPAAPLALAVDVPDSVVVGDAARFTATWTDGSGTFSGSTEDWGDEIATSSRKQGRCEPGEVAPPAAGGTYELGHVWTAPGTYTVVLAVATYVCVDGAAVVDETAETLTVTVLAAEVR